MSLHPSLRLDNDFPELVVLGPVEAAAIRTFVEQFEPYSDFDALSLLAWSASCQPRYRVANLHGNLVVEFGDYLTGDRFLSLLGTSLLDHSVERLLEHSALNGMGGSLRLVPEVVVAQLDHNRWRTTEDDNEHDYVYDVSSLATLAGRQLKSARGSANRFDRRWASRVSIRWMGIEELTGDPEPLLALFDNWASRESEGASESAAERRAIAHLITVADSSPMPMNAPRLSGFLDVDGELTAAWVADSPQPRWVMWHYMKAAASEPGRDVDAWVSRLLCRRASEFGAQLLNMQQDLGIDALRRTKSQYRPIRQLRKFSVSRRP